MDEYGLSQHVIGELTSGHSILDLPLNEESAVAFFADSYELLAACGQFHPQAFDLVFLDFPRASKRKKALLPTMLDSGEISWDEVAHDDPDYLYRLKANCLAIVRLASACLSQNGLLLAIATPDTYIPVRTSIEQFLGSTKFLGELVYQTRSGGANDSKFMDIGHETLLVYAKSPENISGFQIEKEPEELKKYSQEDEHGRFYWDTYIRKQARNYYRIKCPDGKFLEKDEFGNRISWLWKEKTFLAKLEEGEVKFEKIEGKWRLYYKDRLKEFKILRSLVLNKTELSEVCEDVSSGATGAGLLTQRGSMEIKGFNGVKPEYLKSSDFFGFILQVFGRKGRVLIPFSEYGAALSAQQLNPGLLEELVVNNPPEFRALIEWRLSGSSSVTCQLVEGLQRIDLTQIAADPEKSEVFLQNFVLNYDISLDELFQVSGDGYSLFVGQGRTLHVIVSEIDETCLESPVELLEILSDLDFSVQIPVTVWTSLNENVVLAAFSDLTNAVFMNFPVFLIR